MCCDHLVYRAAQQSSCENLSFHQDTMIKKRAYSHTEEYKEPVNLASNQQVTLALFELPSLRIRHPASIQAIVPSHLGLTGTAFADTISIRPRFARLWRDGLLEWL